MTAKRVLLTGEVSELSMQSSKSGQVGGKVENGLILCALMRG